MFLVVNSEGIRVLAMIKKKAKRAGKTEKGKSKAKKGAKRTGVPRTTKPVDPAEARKDIARIVVWSEEDGGGGDGGGFQGTTGSDQVFARGGGTVSASDGWGAGDAGGRLSGEDSVGETEHS